MKIRNLVLAISVLFSGIANAQEITAPEVTKTQVYKAEFALIKENLDFKNLFDKELNLISHEFERKIHNFKYIKSEWERYLCSYFLGQDAIVITPEMMPKLYEFIENLAKKSGISTPHIFISLHKRVLNAAASKIFNSVGGIIIEQKLLNTLTDKQLEAIIAHEIGHIRGQHINKALAIMIPTIFLSWYFVNKGMNYLNDKVNADKLYIPIFGLKLSLTKDIDYYLRAMGISLSAFIAHGLLIGKRFEKEADSFACEAGHAEGLIESMRIFQEKLVEKFDAELLATNDKIQAEKLNLTPQDFAELERSLWITKKLNGFVRWLQAKTPFLPHPSCADRIAAAQAYLDAQAQLPAIEKA
ncbi:MAG: hypothetical protein AMXMBFR12_00650 [Candidatus Babeliales bacterium]